MGGYLVFIIIFLAVAIYALPTLLAFDRLHRNRGAILILNLFLGWTFLGWVIALVWASTDYVEVPNRRVYQFEQRERKRLEREAEEAAKRSKD